MTPTVTQTFAAMGDPVRSTIVDRLASSDATVSELVALFEMSFQAVSQHLSVLERAGLVTRRREGRTRRVQIVTQPLDDAIDWMEVRRRRLEERYQRLDAVLATLDSTDTPQEEA
ncbi:ArsR/SmtB family transcription factor [Spelaeicoccus albus]|uniref:DNA-binding transcriptional ArsR family regulator n=1 Tax=Spelaeicoccus albus TaxID=1280376 RepID=A0A7Z0D2Q2_9MICO|nr:metalloregulator ArsR/SmtB family transcription factor [Spelaeicoccus albus]NYI67781.1 DNA-binding transcriptional ArsR family regulator [Spelaeicoccus albus]